MIVRYNCFETNSSSTHALCIGKGIRLKTPLELISNYKHYSWHTDSDIMEETDYIKIPSSKNKTYKNIWRDQDGIIVELRRIENVGRRFHIYESFQSKCNFIWTCLIYYYKHSNGEWFQQNHKGISVPKLTYIFLNELYKYGFKVRFPDIIMKNEQCKEENWNKPQDLGKMFDEECVPKYARGKWMVGEESTGYFPIDELNVIIQDPTLLWNLLLGNSKIYTGSDEYDTFEDLNFDNYQFKLVGGSDWGECEKENIFDYYHRNEIPKIIGQYINGNYETKIYEDGTRTRELIPKETFYDQGKFKVDLFKVKEIDLMKPKFPESIDLKITNYCENNCKYCYAKSNSKGKHGDKVFIKRMIDGMHPYTEVAIGGGNALAHPDLIEILEFAKSKNVICNITLKDTDIINNEKLIIDLYDSHLIWSVGISPSSIDNLDKAQEILRNRNFVLHLILGIHGKQFIKQIKEKDMYGIERILFLGYKKIGYGKEFYEKHKDSIEKKIEEIKDPNIFELGIETISFDNLAIKQLKLHDHENFDKFYQGDDGKFSFYIDAVEEEFAQSSLKDTDTIGRLSLQGCFEYVNKWWAN